MLIESRIGKRLLELQRSGRLPAAVELWNGQRYAPQGGAGVTLRFPTPSALRRLANADLATLGEAYVEGEVEVDGPIEKVLQAAEVIARDWEGDHQGGRPVAQRLRRGTHSRASDSEAIRYHYDVSNAFYALWLDARMVYSCGYFRRGDEDLDTAQEHKLEHVCRKLRLAPGERLLDIGCGWGALVMHAAARHGVEATGITLSEAQHAWANERIRAAGLEDRCRVLLRDYRDLDREHASFDKVASVGMFEHVGLANLGAYFGIVQRLLKPGGIAMNHGITSADIDSGSVGLGAGAFVDKYVFPDGELPHLSLVVREMAGAGLEVMDVETLRLHYARTLGLWSQRLESRLAAAREHAGERRVRIWRLYLAGCAHAFARGWVTIHQVVATKPADPARPVLPWTRADLYRPDRAP